MKKIKLTLKQAADYAFINGYTTTHFMRYLAHVAYSEFRINIESHDDFYYKANNPYMERVLNWLGYEHSSFGICIKSPLKSDYKNLTINERINLKGYDQSKMNCTSGGLAKGKNRLKRLLLGLDKYNYDAVCTRLCVFRSTPQGVKHF